MASMTQKEKAKAYDEARKQADLKGYATISDALDALPQPLQRGR